MANNNKHTGPNVPALRFPEFSGEWENSRLGFIAEFSKGSGISKDQRSETGNPCILYGELYTRYKSEVIKNVISKTDLPDTELVKSKANDIIIPASGETAEDIATARCVPYDNVLLGGDLNIIRLKNQDGRFFSYQLNGVRKYDIATVAQGVSVVHLHAGDLKGISVKYPSNMAEQRKIAEMISIIDDRIETQSKIIEEQETLLKSLADKLFNTLDTVTKLHLGDISELYQPKTIPLSNLSSKGYPVYGANGIIGSYKNFNHITEQICIACRGSSCGSVNYTVPKAWITGNAMVVNTDNYSNIIDKRYLYYYLRRINYSSLISGSGQPQIVRAPLANLLIPVPTLEKQKHVVLILETVAKILGTNKIILQHYKTQKAYLLSRMFI